MITRKELLQFLCPKVQNTVYCFTFLPFKKWWNVCSRNDRVHVCWVPSVLSDSVTLWTVAHQAPLFMRFSRQRILEWVAMASSRISSATQGLNPSLLSLLRCRQILYPLSHLGSPRNDWINLKKKKSGHHQSELLGSHGLGRKAEVGETLEWKPLQERSGVFITRTSYPSEKWKLPSVQPHLVCTWPVGSGICQVGCLWEFPNGKNTEQFSSFWQNPPDHRAPWDSQPSCNSAIWGGVERSFIIIMVVNTSPAQGHGAFWDGVFSKGKIREFPNGPVVRTPRFHCQGPGFNPWSGK